MILFDVHALLLEKRNLLLFMVVVARGSSSFLDAFVLGIVQI